MRQKKEEIEEMLWVSCEINLIMTLRSLKKIGINEKFINIEEHKKFNQKMSTKKFKFLSNVRLCGFP